MEDTELIEAAKSVCKHEGAGSMTRFFNQHVFRLRTGSLLLALLITFCGPPARGHFSEPGNPERTAKPATEAAVELLLLVQEADAKKNERDFETAIDLYQEALARIEDSELSAANRDQLREKIYFALAYLFRLREDFAQAYSHATEAIRVKRAIMNRAFHSASSEERHGILYEARKYVLNALVQALFPMWYGTPWDFNGVSEVPREGAIACGYFVTTLLRDAGFHIARVQMAQEASEPMIRSLAEPSDIRRFSDVKIVDFVKAVKEMGPGLFVVGLDCHTGFLVYDGTEVRFVHSSYYPPYEVVSEPAPASGPLVGSRYRVVGKILSDRLMKKWLNQSSICRDCP